MRYTIPVAAYVLVALTSTYALPVFEDGRNHGNEAADAGVDLAARCGGAQRLNGEGFVKRDDFDDQDHGVDFQARCSGGNRYGADAGFAKRDLPADKDDNNDDGMQLAARCSRTASLGQQGYVKRDVPDEEGDEADVEEDDGEDNEDDGKLEQRSFDDAEELAYPAHSRPPTPRSYEGAFAYAPRNYGQRYPHTLREEYDDQHYGKRDGFADANNVEDGAEEVYENEDEEGMHKRAVIDAAIQTVKPSFLSGAFKTLGRPRYLVPLTGAAAGMTGYELSNAHHHPYSRHNPFGYRPHHQHHPQGENDAPVLIAIAEQEPSDNKFETGFPSVADHDNIIFGRDLGNDDEIEEFTKRGAPVEVFYDAVSTAAKPLAEEAGIISKAHPVKTASFGSKAKALLKNKHTKTAAKAVGLGTVGASGYALGEHHRDHAHGFVDGDAVPFDESEAGYGGEWQPVTGLEPAEASQLDGSAQTAPAVAVMAKRAPQGAAAAEAAVTASKTALKTAEGAGAAATKAVDTAGKAAGKGLLAGKKALAAGVAAVSGTGFLAYNSGKSAGLHAAEINQANNLSSAAVTQQSDVAVAAKRSTVDTVQGQSLPVDNPDGLTEAGLQQRTTGWGILGETRPINRSSQASKWAEKRAEVKEKRFYEGEGFFVNMPGNGSANDTEQRVDERARIDGAQLHNNHSTEETSQLEKRLDTFDIPFVNRTARGQRWVAKREESDSVELDKREPNIASAVAKPAAEIVKPAAKAVKPFYKSKKFLGLAGAGIVGGGFMMHKMHKHATNAAAQPVQLAARAFEGDGDDDKDDDGGSDTEKNHFKSRAAGEVYGKAADFEKRQVVEAVQTAGTFFSKPAVAKSLLAAGTVGAAGTAGYLLGDNHDKIDDLYHGSEGDYPGKHSMSDSSRGSSDANDDTDTVPFTPTSQIAVSPNAASDDFTLGKRETMALRPRDEQSEGRLSTFIPFHSLASPLSISDTNEYDKLSQPDGEAADSLSSLSTTTLRHSLVMKRSNDPWKTQSSEKSGSSGNTSSSGSKHKISIQNPKIVEKTVRVWDRGWESPSKSSGSSSSSSSSSKKSRRSLLPQLSSAPLEIRSSSKSSSTGKTSSSGSGKSSGSHKISISSPRVDLPSVRAEYTGSYQSGGSGSASSSSGSKISKSRRSLLLKRSQSNPWKTGSGNSDNSKKKSSGSQITWKKADMSGGKVKWRGTGIIDPPKKSSGASSSGSKSSSSSKKSRRSLLLKRSGTDPWKTGSKSSNTRQSSSESKHKIVVKAADTKAPGVRTTWKGPLDSQGSGTSSSGTSSSSSSSRSRRSLPWKRSNRDPWQTGSKSSNVRQSSSESKTKIYVKAPYLEAPSVSMPKLTGIIEPKGSGASSSGSKSSSSSSSKKSRRSLISDDKLDSSIGDKKPVQSTKFSATLSKPPDVKSVQDSMVPTEKQPDELAKQSPRPVYAPAVFRPRKRNVGATLVDAVRGGLTNTNVLAGSIGLTTLLGGSAMAGYEVGKITGERRKDIHVYHHDGAEAEKADRIRKHRDQSVVGALHDIAVPT